MKSAVLTNSRDFLGAPLWPMFLELDGETLIFENNYQNYEPFIPRSKVKQTQSDRSGFVELIIWICRLTD